MLFSNPRQIWGILKKDARARARARAPLVGYILFRSRKVVKSIEFLSSSTDRSAGYAPGLFTISHQSQRRMLSQTSGLRPLVWLNIRLWLWIWGIVKRPGAYQAYPGNLSWVVFLKGNLLSFDIKFKKLRKIFLDFMQNFAEFCKICFGPFSAVSKYF